MDGLEVIDQTADVDQNTDIQDDISSGVSDASVEASTDATDKTSDKTEDKIDGRRFNSEWSKYLKEMRDAAALDPEKGPKVADMLTKLRDNYARYQSVQELAPKGVDDIRAWKTTIDAVGGPEAAAEMMQRVAGMDAMDAKIEAGDDSFVDELPENLQKGVFGMVPRLLNRLSESDTAAFSAAVAPHFQKALAGTGLGTVLDGQLAGLKSIYDRTTDPEMKAEIRELYQSASKTKTWYDGQTSGAAGLPEGNKTVSPEVTRLRAQVEANETGKRQEFVNGVLATRDKAIESSFKEHVSTYVKQLGLSDAQQADLMESFAAKVRSNQVEGTPFFKQLKAYASLKNRNQKTVDDYINSATTQDAKSIIDGLVTARYGGMRQRKAPVAIDTPTTQVGAVRVAQIPDQSEWSDKMYDLGHAETVAKGIFHLKNGKTVQVVRQ